MEIVKTSTFHDGNGKITYGDTSNTVYARRLPFILEKDSVGRLEFGDMEELKIMKLVHHIVLVVQVVLLVIGGNMLIFQAFLCNMIKIKKMG